jgi:5-methylcytosine-specific restriction enzyme A
LEQFSADVQTKLKRLMDVLAHTESGRNLDTLVGMLADLGLEKLDPMKKSERAEVRAARTAHANNGLPQMINASAKHDAPVPAPARVNVKPSAKKREYISASVRRALFARDKYQCTSCESSRALEIDHVVPFAKGGKSELSNLRLLCRSCNQRHAIESYGLTKMNCFLKEPSRKYSA